MFKLFIYFPDDEYQIFPRFVVVVAVFLLYKKYCNKYPYTYIFPCVFLWRLAFKRAATKSKAVCIFNLKRYFQNFFLKRYRHSLIHQIYVRGSFPFLLARLGVISYLSFEHPVFRTELCIVCAQILLTRSLYRILKVYFPLRLLMHTNFSLFIYRVIVFVYNINS